VRSDSGATSSLWMAQTETPTRPTLRENLTTDVCVVGAGLAGLSVAYHLAKSDREVVVIDDGPIGGGETGRTTAHLASAIDDRYFELEKIHGVEHSRLAAESHTAAIDRIEQIAQEENIDCDFRRVDGYLFLEPGDTSETLLKERDAAIRAGLEVRYHDDVTLPSMYNLGPCLVFPRQGQFHPLKYMDGLVRAVERRGGRFFRAHGEEIKGGMPARVRTSDGNEILCEAVVVATNSPVNDRVAIHTKQAPYRTYVVGALVPKNSVPYALFWDTADPYHYVRVQTAGSDFPDKDVLIVGGEDHKTGQADDYDRRFGRLEQWTAERFPVERIAFRWSGQVIETDDYLGFIGRNPLDDENVFIATGDSGMGMTHGTIAGMLIHDLILNRKNPWAKVYDPGRVRLRTRSVMEFIKENLNVVLQYRDYVTPSEYTSVADISPGSGGIVRQGATKLAVCRDHTGAVHTCLAICPHLGGVVRWNPVEETWDCPVHGSRFDPKGCVINGPANRGLTKAETEELAA